MFNDKVWLHVLLMSNWAPRRHGVDSTPLLLARCEHGHFTASGNEIGISGCGVHALYLVRLRLVTKAYNARANILFFVSATASKANWISLVTGISHEKLNVFHRWISFAFFALALLHALSFVVYHIHFHDMVEQVTQVEPEEYWTGIVALVFQGWLTFASLSPIR